MIGVKNDMNWELLEHMAIDDNKLKWIEETYVYELDKVYVFFWFM